MRNILLNHWYALEMADKTVAVVTIAFEETSTELYVRVMDRELNIYRVSPNNLLVLDIEPQERMNDD